MALLGSENLNKALVLVTAHVTCIGAGEVSVERGGIELREHIDLGDVDVAVEAVAHRDVCQPVVRSQRNRRLHALLRQRCSPTTHPGSFRCSLHKGFGSQPAVPYSPHRLNARRSAMTNSLVRIGGVEGDLVKRALAALIRPSSHQQRRRSDFQPRPSRLSVMCKSDE
jgi:hypothetical protein